MITGVPRRLYAGRWLLCLATCVCLMSCDKKQAVQSAAPTQFPGYEQVGKSGDAAQLWFNPSDIQRVSNAYVLHTLKTLEGGYARFDVLTDCRNTIQRVAGTQYRQDGTADQAYPGNDAPVSAKSEPGMGALIEAACAVAISSRAIHGNFNVPAGLELLYGPYDKQTGLARWTDAAVPKDLPWIQNLELSGSDVFLVSSVGAFDFTDDGKKKRLLVTNAHTEGGDCHACTGLLGAATFIQDGADWKVESTQPYLASLGEFGKVGDQITLNAAGDSNYALLIIGSDMHQGYQTASIDVFLREKDGKFTRVISEADTGASDEETVSADAAFVKVEDSQHYRVKVAFTYAMPGQKTYVADHWYEYSAGKYVLVRKDDPPKFVLPKDGSGTDAALSSFNTATMGSASTTTSKVLSGAPSVSVAGLCPTANDCVTSMLQAAKSGDLVAAMAGADAFGRLPKPVRGDRVTARKLNTEALVLLNAGDAPGAVRVLTAATAADASDEEIQSNLAYALSLAGDLAQSISTATAALNINPRRTSVWAPLAVTFSKQKNRAKALEAMWLAYQFSADKQKTVDFINSRFGKETDLGVIQMYSDALVWFTQGKVPVGL